MCSGNSFYIIGINGFPPQCRKSWNIIGENKNRARSSRTTSRDFLFVLIRNGQSQKHDAEYRLSTLDCAKLPLSLHTLRSTPNQKNTCCQKSDSEDPNHKAAGKETANQYADAKADCSDAQDAAAHSFHSEPLPFTNSISSTWKSCDKKAA